ncbi:hypothetical protein STEG23_035582 [Scotinomys teguina]
MTVTPLGWDQDCSLKIRELEVLAPWFLDPGGWSKTAAVRLFFIFPGICTLSLNQENPHWVPSRLTCVVLELRGRDEPEAQDDGCLDPDGDPDATMAQQTMPHGEDGTLGSDQSLAGADATSC